MITINRNDLRQDMLKRISKILMIDQNRARFEKKDMIYRHIETEMAALILQIFNYARV